jgi:hypothetical protein
VYYIVWMYVLPHFGKYSVRQETVYLEGETTNTHRLVRVPNDEIAAWDAAHDPTGKAIDESVGQAAKGDSDPEKFV